MKNTLQLNFNDKTKMQPCLDALAVVSPVPFTFAKGGPDTRDILTKPEYIDVKAQAVLTFATEEATHQFMRNPVCRQTFQDAAS